MVIALLAVLGVDLVVIVVLVGTLLARRRWVKRQPGVFAGAIRVKSGDLDGLGSSCPPTSWRGSETPIPTMR
jgi:hypothetical protein